MYKITGGSRFFSIFFVTSLTIVNPALSTSNTNESVLESQTYCKDAVSHDPIKYPKCSDKTLENEICSIVLSQLRPTQFNYGKDYVDKMVESSMSSIGYLKSLLNSKLVSIVIGPKSVPNFFLTDGHHRIITVRKVCSEKFTLLVKVARNFMIENSNQSEDEFWKDMEKNNYVYLNYEGDKKDYKELPKKMESLTNDPYRSLIGYIADDKSNFCFDKDLPSYGNYAEFYWADYFRKFDNLDKYNDQIMYNTYKDKILYFYNPKTGKMVNICKLPEAEKLPGFNSNLSDE